MTCLQLNHKQPFFIRFISAIVPGMEPIERREALRRLSIIIGGSVSASIAGAFLSGCGTGGPGVEHAFKTLTAAQQQLVAAIADAIIPETDTPGASGAGVQQYIDLILSDWLEVDETDRFLDGLRSLESSFEEVNGISFVEASQEDQLAWLEPLDKAASEARQAGTNPLPFFATMKELVVTGYYTSEIGATQELRFQIIFDKYEGDVELKEGDRAWSGLEI